MTWSDIPGWFDFEDLYRRVADEATDASLLIEVGCWKGRSIAFLADELRRRGKSPVLLAVDTWAGSPAEEHMLDEVARLGGPDALYREFLTNMLQCGLNRCIWHVRTDSVDAASRERRASANFCFIDGSHDFASVRRDLEAWLPVMKPGALLAGHDINQPDVARAVRDTFGEDFEIEGSCWLHRLKS